MLFTVNDAVYSLILQPLLLCLYTDLSMLTDAYLLQGAKNHGVIMPDANKEATLNAVGG